MMKPTFDYDRGPGSRLFGIPPPARPFEPLAIAGAFVCLVAHFVPISALNEVAASGGMIEGEELPEWYHRTIRLLLSSVAVSLLALLRIWWRGHSRQGVMLVFFSIVTCVWMMILLGFARGDLLAPMAEVDNLEGFNLSLTYPVFLLCTIGYGTLLYGGYYLLTRLRRSTQWPTLTAGLMLLLAAAVAGASWTALTVRSELVRATFSEYREVLPESTTADPYVSPLSDGCVEGVVLVLDGEESVTCYGLRQYTNVSLWKEDALAALGELFEDWPPSLKERHDWLLEIDSGEPFGEIPSMQRWLDSSLFLAPRPDHRFEDLTELLDVAREVFPERPNVVLLVCRRYGRARGVRAMLTGEEVSALHGLPLETLAIPGAATVRLDFRDSRIVLELNGESLEDERELTARLVPDRPLAVDFTSHPGVHVDYLVRILDAIRSAGAIRLAIPPAAEGAE